MKRVGIFTLLAVLVAIGPVLRASQAPPEKAARPAATQISTAELDAQIRAFFAREVAAHVADIKTFDPPPERVVGALTTGEFSWGSFMRTLGAYTELADTRTVAGRDVAPMIAKMGLIELHEGGKTWAQLYAALALRHFGRDLKQNALWQSLSVAEQQEWRALLDPNRFYDVKTHTLIHLPENYFGVAARIAAIDYQLGLTTDRAYADDLLNRAARQFTDGALFADDALPTGRYDRYSNEYARNLYEAAENIGRKDIMNAVAPSLTAQMYLWWDLLSPDGYGYPWGRSLGAIGYMDTMEIAAFLGENPRFRPAPLAQLAAAYYAAWRWLENDFNPNTHLLSVFAFGRGDYSYITKEREWQQTTTFFAKIIVAHHAFMPVLEKEHVGSIAPRPELGNVARFVFFRNDGGRKFGVWVVRRGSVHFALPFVTGPKGATSDYEPAPHGLPGFSVPVQKIYPCFALFITLENGETIAAADGADEIRPSADGLSVTAVWRHWVVPDAKAGETVDPGLTSEVTWTLAGNTLRRSEVITAARFVTARRIWLAIPTRANHIETTFADEMRTDRLTFDEGALEVRVVHIGWPLQISGFATGDDPLGRGDCGPIPLHLMLSAAQEISFTPGAPKRWEIEITSAAPRAIE